MKQTTRPREIDPKTLLSNLILIAFVFGTIGIALKFTTYFDHWIYFPAFPNASDSTFLILSVTYFAAYIIHKNRQHQTKTETPDSSSPHFLQNQSQLTQTSRSP